MTDAQYDRLPGILRRIVDADREMDAVRQAICAPVLSIDRARAAAKTFRHRRAMTAEAEKQYGHRLAGAGPALA